MQGELSVVSSVAAQGGELKKYLTSSDVTSLFGQLSPFSRLTSAAARCLILCCAAQVAVSSHETGPQLPDHPAALFCACSSLNSSVLNVGD